MDHRHDHQDVSEVSERLEKSLSIDTEDRMETYHRLISDGKDAAKNGDIGKALELFKQAYNFHQTPKLESRIKKIEELVAQTDLEDEDDEFVNVNNSGLMLFRELYDKLYDYQRDGISFLYGLYRDGRRGGVLADDMGLGKTIQIISFLSGMYDNELIKHTLLIMPMSLITNWTKEFSKWTPGMRVKEFHGASKAERTRNLEKIQRRGGVIVTTYTMLINNWQQLASYQGKEFCWDYMILDEAHKIKNTSTKTAKSAYAIPSTNRILLTGTPVQNNLREMWTLFDFACQGTLLGSAKTFKAEYENPITRAREKDATPGEKALGFKMSENLMAIIKPYFLRRTKSEVQKKKTDVQKEDPEDKNNQVPDDQTDSGAIMPKLTRKNDLIVWTYLSDVQEDIYRQFIALDHVKELLMTTRSPLAELTILKKLCDHPRLLSANAIAKLGLEENPSEGLQGENTQSDSHSIANVPDENLISESGKLLFLLELLERLKEEGHRTLVFAHYRMVLNILERILGNRGFKVLRLDGTITQITEREKLISRFQRDKSYSVFLLTTQVGGVGITLTAADRVVIYDPSWNPATDAQAVDRAYRIGQTENVVIYRLITCGTVEEKIYRRQVFKDSLIKQNTGDKKNPFRYFSSQELRELFILEDTRSSSTQLQLQTLHSSHRRSDPDLDEHIAHLHQMHMFGISDHDLMFSLDINHDEGPENQEEHQYIEERVLKAQELVKVESELQMQLAENISSGTAPTWLREPPSTNSRETSHEKKPKPSPSHTQADDFNKAPVVVDLDCSGSGEEDIQQNKSIEVIDLTTAPSPLQKPWMDEEPVDKCSGDANQLQVSADDDNNGANRTSQSEVDPLQTTRLSVLQQSNLSFREETSRGSAELEFCGGNFNLQLEDSQEVLENEEEEEEQKLLSQLQMNGSFDVSRSLHRRTFNSCQASDVDESIVITKKNRGAVIYDSDEEEDEEEQQLKSPLNNSFQVLGASTPKSGPSCSSPRQLRKSVGGSTSVVSHRSLLQSIIEDMDFQEEEEGSEGEEGGKDSNTLHSEEEREENIKLLTCSEPEEMSGNILNSEEEEEGEEGEEMEEGEALDVTKSSDNMKFMLEEETESDKDEDDDDASKEHFEIQQEEDPLRSTDDELHLKEAYRDEEESEEEAQDSSESADVKPGEDLSFSLEESSCEPELASGEKMDRCTVESESYDSLVQRGKECYSQKKLEDALSFFLRAIDIKPGDPEIQFMTIQLYRQLSQGR